MCGSHLKKQLNSTSGLAGKCFLIFHSRSFYMLSHKLNKKAIQTPYPSVPVTSPVSLFTKKHSQVRNCVSPMMN